MSRAFATASTAGLLVLMFLAMTLPVCAAAPTIISFMPDNGKVGDVITVIGTGLTSTTEVKFNGTSANPFPGHGDTNVSVMIPVGATTGKVSVITPDGTADSESDFTIWVPVSLDITVDPGYGFNAAFTGLTVSYSLTGHNMYSNSVTFDGTGKATIGSLRPGTYTLSLFGSHWLRRTISGVNVNGLNSVVTTLANGDADGDNQVNLFDSVVLDANFGSADAMADLDGSGLVNLFDYVIIDSYFGAKGDGDGQMTSNPIDNADMVWVSAGSFLRGSISGTSNEMPQRSIYLDGYWIYKYEVTVAQYRAFCLATNRTMPDAPDWGWQETSPIVKVTWYDALAYATWAKVALPTEAQWEKAARGTDGRIYPWGDVWDETKCCNFNNPVRGTKMVGSFPSGVSPYGCMDMAGNVWEWCADWYSDTYYQTSPDKNPLGPPDGFSSIVLRGDAWNDPYDNAFRCAFRNPYAPFGYLNSVGFRCVKAQ